MVSNNSEIIGFCDATLPHLLLWSKLLGEGLFPVTVWFRLSSHLGRGHCIPATSHVPLGPTDNYLSVTIQTP